MAGKGGVGKTTVGATLGVAAARTGRDVLLIELEGHSNLAAPFGLSQLRYEATTLEEPVAGGRLRARQITPDAALREYLDSSGLSRISDRMTRTGAVEVVATAAPGIRDLLALGKIRQLEQNTDHELIVVDAPAAGHAISFLRAAAGLARSTSTGPVRQQADQVLELLSDGRRCQVLLVTVPEESPVTEVVETAYSLEDQIGVSLGPLVVNSCWPGIDGLEWVEPEGGTVPVKRNGLEDAARFRLSRIAVQEAEIERLKAELPLPVIELPFLFTTSLDRGHLDHLADCLIAQLDGGAP